MQEIALLLSSIAGVCTAVAAKKFPKNKKKLPTLGVNSQIKNQINSLRIEKEILTKTITRLYQNYAGLTKIQRDRLLSRYQHQLGIILAKIEKLEAASKHPDLGPVGDGLITLMDQKLSQLDQKLYEISSKITVASSPIPEIKKEVIKPKEQPKPQVATENIEPKDEEKLQEKVTEKTPGKKHIEIPSVVIPSKPSRFELTTLTEISKQSQFPLIEQKLQSKNELVEEILKLQGKIPEKVEIIQPISPKPEIKSELQKQEIPLQLPTPKMEEQITTSPEEKPKPDVKLPEDDNVDDEDDLDKIKGEIMKTLSRLEQAEVE